MTEAQNAEIVLRRSAAGLVHLNRRSEIGRDEGVVFLHTGGPAGLFGYHFACNHSDRILPTAEE